MRLVATIRPARSISSTTAASLVGSSNETTRSALGGLGRNPASVSSGDGIAVSTDGYAIVTPETAD
jgi:hypothetical protein